MAVRKQRPVPPAPTGFVASAVRLPQVNKTMPRSTQAWMEEAWGFYDTVPELRYVANWVGNLMSRAELRVAEEVDGELRVLTDGPAVEALDAYYGNFEGRAQMLQQTGVNLTITGEAYHLWMGGDDQWSVLSSGRVVQDSRNVTVDTGNGRVPLQGSDLCIRVWVPHPRDPVAADSPVRSNRGTLREIQRLNEHISAQLESRLAGAGILLMPSEMQFSAPEGSDPQDSQADHFMRVLADAMMTPIQDRGSAAAVVPIVVTAPGDVLRNVQHINFWSPLDNAVIGMRDNAIKHLALGLDTPPEVLTGIADTNHWNAWLVDEAAIKSHLEPRLQVVTAAITAAYLRPALTGNVPDPDMFHVVADTSAIRLRPDLSTQAIDLYDRGELSGEALRRETGFELMDAPDDQEKIAWLLKKVATGSTSPEQSIAALRRLGADLGIVEITDQTNTEPPDHMRTDTEPDRVRREPDIDRAINRRDNAALYAACDALVLRALERAGNKLCDTKARQRGLHKVPPFERHVQATGSPDALLDGAWSTADHVLATVADNTSRVITALDMYVRGLLINQTPHSKDAMIAALQAGGG